MQVYDSGCLTDTGLTPVPQMVDECRTDNGAVVYISFSDTDSPGDDIAYMPNPSVDDLMKICSSLKHCTGFSSSGWIKSDTAQRRPLVGSSLYVKRPFERPCLITKPSPVSAAYNHHQHAQYLEMTNHIRIYIYPTSVGVNMVSTDDYKYGVEQLFIDLLSKSEFVTSNPKEAHFFFLPLRCTAYRKSVRGLQEGLAVARKVAMEMIEDIRFRYPFWNHSMGMDHFYICAHDMGSSVLEMVPQWKNVIALVNSASAITEYFVPNKDISIPNHPGRGVVPWHVLGSLDESDFSKRRTILFFAGNPSRGSVRPNVFKYFSSTPDVKLIAGYLSEANYTNYLKNSKYCLCPRGNEVWSPRLIESLWFGCVPIIIANHYILPLNDIIDWSKAAVIVLEENLSETLKVLQSISRPQWLAYHNYGRKVLIYIPSVPTHKTIHMWTLPHTQDHTHVDTTAHTQDHTHVNTTAHTQDHTHVNTTAHTTHIVYS
jgi:hypothetical protein